ncbi:MAG: YHS domain-containing (seleno)protein [Calditrichia bacterium]
MYNRLKTLIVSLLFIGSMVYGGELVNVAGASDIAIGGYDPVAFFTVEKPTHGNPGIKAEHQGATYLFTSEKNRDLFKKNPEKYAPQFGGFCAYGAAVNALFPIDISTWQVRDGKLYLNLNPDILAVFNKDFDKNVAKAEANWNDLTSKHVEDAN